MLTRYTLARGHLKRATCQREKREIMDDSIAKSSSTTIKPQYRGHLDPNDIQFEDDNPLCGDHIEVTLRVDETGKVTDGRFDGKGCAISAGFSRFIGRVDYWQPVERLKKLSKQDVLICWGSNLDRCA